VRAADAGSALAAVLGDAVTGLIDRSLDLDPATRARLTSLDGQRIRIDPKLPLEAPTFDIEIRGGHLHRAAHRDAAPQAIVSGSPVAIAAWLAGVESAAAGVRIDGDSAVVAEFGALLRGFRPDPGLPLERLLGRELTRDLLGTAELALGALRSAVAGGADAVRHGAGSALAERRQLDGFLDRLDDLRLRVDRLAARVADQESRRTAP
jgi:ubiquinone biosynthesis accessory factor UbiJ